ncbi:hypothetical protein GLOIN_2v1775288 [Rhizophagus irregularis DAOM 181602=DAOM 197198]|nr:hypothetical protein GLOIN_2v1775288 [Rhizophagus irregularis DAOM 181602=DAOM 197198]
MPQSTSLNIESDVYNTSEQNTEMSMGSESNNESYNEIFEDYSPPPYQANMDAEENPIDDKFSWILLWIMNYRITYNIPETATESLIKFMKIVLNEIGGENFRFSLPSEKSCRLASWPHVESRKLAASWNATRKKNSCSVDNGITGVRWSELLRLPYFDPIRFTIVDPMHYRKILTHFVRICSILVSRIIESDMLQEAHRRLVKIIKLIEVQYGRNKITTNLHLSLHLSECCHDFGPLYAFWCFSFKRMNGILGSLPNSNRKIEPELMRRLMNDNRIRDIITSSAQMKGLELLENHPTVGSLSENDQFASDEMERFWLNSKNIQESTVTGCEAFPGEMLRPTSENVVLSQSMLDLMIDYYIATYEICRIGSEVFGFELSFRHIKSSYVLAKFITTDGEVDRYPGQVQYYLKHEIDLPNGPTEHYLAFIRWYRPANTANIRYHFSIDDTEETETCNVELWKTDFFPESRDCIIPVHNILCRFVPTKYKISSNRNATEYLAINPLNRKFHIR